MARKKTPEFSQFRLWDGGFVRLITEQIIMAWTTDTPGEVLLILEGREDPVRVIYPWSALNDLLPAEDHRRRMPKRKTKVKGAGLSMPGAANLTRVSL